MACSMQSEVERVTWAPGDRVKLMDGVGTGSQAVVTDVHETHCTVIVLDAAWSRGMQQLWPSLHQLEHMSQAWRIGSRVTLRGLASGKLRHLNGATGSVAKHPREPHPIFARKSNKKEPDGAGESPQLRLVVRLDEQCRPEKGPATVCLEARHVVPEKEGPTVKAEEEGRVRKLSVTLAAMAATLPLGGEGLQASVSLRSEDRSPGSFSGEESPLCGGGSPAFGIPFSDIQCSGRPRTFSPGEETVISTVASTSEGHCGRPSAKLANIGPGSWLSQGTVLVASYKAAIASAAGGAVVLGTGGGATGLATGGAVGAAVGLVPALFTFGLSVPLFAAVGGGCGLVVGTTVGGTTGAVAGAGGYCLFKRYAALQN